ncbi:dihydrodipicolinate reductase [Paramicrobacterium humi]|uniref:4-hydroxy-tetrahydrodipicolinate reductase n=1 Tax=Paramicrobacterium humi TaxID=640635 RepID=A0A1H4PRH1_9MICO|nr:4-hydroxy-tetrahydrodipicolinate reductase [Microbacterium humi]SEC09901.1 dihydrodipicolinate reductase [Microbacterium humi]
MTTRVAVAGASGKMGRLFVSLIEDLDGFEVTAQLGSGSAREELDDADLVVDVTTIEASREIVARAVAAGKKVLVGTSGWSEALVAELRGRVTGDAGVLIIPNFSLGSVLGTTLATIASRFYSSIEVLEAHRASKVDSPSGTAVRTAELMAAAREGLGPVEAPHSDQRARGQLVAGIPVHSMRLRGMVAAQEVSFGGDGEILSIRHDTISQDAYVRGIQLSLEAVRGITGVVVGLENVLDLGIGRA